MRTAPAVAVLILASVLGVPSAHAQGALPAPAAPAASNVVTAPTYVAIELETTVNRPAAEVWRRVGKYCDIQEWLGLACTITSGIDGGLGAVRTLANVGPEIIVARTQLSYTYSQPVRPGVPYNQYHGTLEARVLTPTTTRLRYQLVLDNSMLANDEARTADIERRRTRFSEALANMKILAEGGTLPAPPAATAPAAPARP